uniref:hypothetical protein n=1 Tax=Phocaeicola coprophilus TaxID=387090 RepID=UPI0030790D23
FRRITRIIEVVLNERAVWVEKKYQKKYSRKFADSKIMRTFASPLRNKALSKRVLERWQSGRLRRS